MTEILGRIHRYNKRVFFTPPWPDIYVTDRERRHSLAEAMEECSRLAAIYPALGYEIRVLPKAPVQERADYVLATLAD